MVFANCKKGKQVDQRATIAHLRAIINLWGLFKCSSAAYSTVNGSIWLNFELIQNIMYVLITCKDQQQTRKKGETSILRHSMAANSVVRCQIWPKFELIEALMHVLITCKYQKNRIKNNQEKVETTFYPL